MSTEDKNGDDKAVDGLQKMAENQGEVHVYAEELLTPRKWCS